MCKRTEGAMLRAGNINRALVLMNEAQDRLRTAGELLANIAPPVYHDIVETTNTVNSLQLEVDKL
jgi:hypothetical protein